MLVIPRRLHEEVLAHCVGRYPKEACGILAAPGLKSTPGDSERVVAQVYPMRNVEDSPIGYAMDPLEQLRLEKLMRQRDQRLIGIFHSHTASDAYPSPVDVRMAISSEIAYVLVSLKDRARPDFKSYTIEGTTITPEAVRVVP